MKTNMLFSGKTLFMKIVLLAALIVGGGNSAWGGDLLSLSFEGLSGTDAPSGWTATDIKYENDYLRGTSNYTTYYLISSSTYKIDNGQKIIITAKSLHTSNAKVRIYFSTSSESATFSQTPNKEFTTEIRKDLVNDYQLTYENNTDRTCYLQFSGYYALIKKIEIKAAIPELTTIDENINPGEFKNSTPSSLTVKYTANTGWNTICMPIQLRTWSVNHLNSIYGASWKAYTLSSYSNGVLTFASIAASGYIQANTPLLVYAPNATGEQSSLVLSSTSVTYAANPCTTIDGATFQGTYATKTYTSDDSWYGVTPAGKVMKAGTGASVKGYHAYFTGISAPAGARISIVIEGDDETTDLGFVKMVDPEAQDVYNLKGQRVQKGSKGLYIVNGRKVVIK